MTYDITDERLHKCMVNPYQHGARPVHPYPQISNHLADLVKGTHDLTLFDHPNGEMASARPPFYDHAHYVGAIALLYKAVQEIGWVEHTGDWDWWTGLTLRDGTRVGDGFFVYEGNTDEDYDKADAHGYCDDLIAPSVKDPSHFPQSADHSTNVYAAMGVRLESWTTDNIALKEAYRVDQIASIHIGER